jgi:endoglucanase
MMDNLMKLSNTSGVSGYEWEVGKLIKNIFDKYCDETYIDEMGNVVGIKKALTQNSRKIMLAAHSDEIGLMVKNIDDKGFVQFTSIGGVDHRILPGLEVIIHGKEKFFGVIGAKPPHLQKKDETKKAITYEDMSIDTGISANKLKEFVNIGDIISFNISSCMLLNNLVTGKSLDNRAGISVIENCLSELQSFNINSEIYSIATVQEEVGLRGAIMGSYKIAPDIAIVIDVCHGGTPDASRDETSKINNGPVITMGPNIHPKLVGLLQDTAKEYNFNFQVDIEPGNTGTDAWAIQVSRTGVPTVLISVPLRYMHTTVETVSIDDIKKSGKLMAFFIKRLEEETEDILCC